jgi:hypothetical protein
VSRDAPKDRFSAERARDVNARLVGDGATRFVGTLGNERGRGVIVSELEKSGWTVETQRAFSCTYHGMCAPVVNVVGRFAGREPKLPGVLMTAHYDSVPVSPGATDDGFGVSATLEAARALAAGPPPRRNVVAVLSDGEEAGLLGMDAFVRGHALAETVRTTVNVDARGSRGPSFMFETSKDNAWLVAMMASHLERPVTTSLFYEVYQRMPNDTDFSITKRIASGVNFANTEGIENYHTPLDTLAAADVGTLQHHGDHLLSMTRAFAEAEVGTREDTHSNAVWFDVFALGIVRWPLDWSLPLALGALALVLLQTVRARAVDRGLLALVALFPGVAASALMGWALKRAGALPAFWLAHPLPALTALEAAAALAVLASSFALAKRATPRSLWAGTWLGWGALAVTSAAVAPGASYLFIVPTLVAGLSGGLPLGAACVLPAVAASALLFPLETGLYDALGFVAAPLLTVPTMLLATALAPMLSGLSPPVAKRAAIALGAVAFVAGVVALFVPKFSPTHPQRVNVVFRQDEDRARVFVDASWGWARWGEPPPPMLAAIGGAVAQDQALPWALPAAFAEVPRVDAKMPSAVVLAASDDGKARHVRARVRSDRGASTLGLVFPSGRHVDVKVEGHQAFPRPIGAVEMVAVFAVPSDGVVVDLDANGAAPITFTVLDQSAGVPPGTKAEDAVRARPSDAVPAQYGDVTVATRLFSL